MPRLISLASGVLPEFSPLETVAAAAEAGWPATGLTIDPDSWTNGVAREVRQRLTDADMIVLDVEVIWLKPVVELSRHFRILDAGAEIGARNALVVSSDGPEKTAATLARLADHAGARGMRVSLEFAAFTSVRSLASALAVLEQAAQPQLGLLVDALHFQRTGGVPDDLRAVDAARFAYAQFCDAPLMGPAESDVATIVAEALHGRLEIGEGELPLRGLSDALPDQTPLSIELRSRALREAWPVAADRARALLASTRAGLEQL